MCFAHYLEPLCSLECFIPPHTKGTFQGIYIVASKAFSLTHLFVSGFWQPVTYFLVVQSLSHVQLCDLTWTATYQASLRYLVEFAQTHVHWVNDAIQPSHLLLPPSPPALSFSQHQGLFRCVGSLHQVANVLELQLQHQSFQWTLRVDFL